MLKIEKFVTASPEQWEIIIEGMRNPMNSWGKMDSFCHKDCDNCSDRGKCDYVYGSDLFVQGTPYRYPGYIGPNDHSLMERLDNAGTEHRKFMRMIPVWVTLSAPLYWWKEMDTYKIGTTRNSCSTMHKIQAKEFTYDDFSCEHMNRRSSLHLKETIDLLNDYREKYLVAVKTESETGLSAKDIWWQMIQLLPSSYNQKATLFLNYEVLSNIYHQRKNHKLDDWHTFCDWVRELPYSELITKEFE